MEEKVYKAKMPDIMEAIFDAAYLIFDLIAGILFFSFAKGNTLFILYGILTLTLCGGNAFHLVPRIIRAVKGTSDKIKKQLGIGLQVSSITMTVFYIILMYIWKYTFPELDIPVAIEAIIWISAIIRIIMIHSSDSDSQTNKKYYSVQYNYSGCYPNKPHYVCYEKGRCRCVANP